MAEPIGIATALGDANFRIAAVNGDVLNEYKETLTNTTPDLEERLQEVDNKLQTLSLKGTQTSVEDAAEREWAQKERESIKQCLTICAQASEHVGQVRTNIFEDVSADRDAHQVITATLGDLISAR